MTTHRILSSGKENGTTFNQHPLQISLVVHKIFQYLETCADFNTLKNIRLVCTLWRDESLSWWRKTATLWLIPDCTNGGHFAQETFTMLLQKLQPSSNGFYQVVDKPFQKYKLQNTIINIPNSFQKHTSTNSLWNFVGPLVKHLTVAQVQIYKEEKKRSRNISSFMKFLATHAPNLEHLTINNSFFNTTDPVSRSRKLVQHFGVKYLEIKTPFENLTLDNFPNLEYLLLEKHSVSDLVVMLKRFINNQPENVKLKHLKVLNSTNWNAPRRRDFNVLLGVRQFPKLEQISIGFLKCVKDLFTINLFQEVLNTLGTNSLKILELFEWPFAKPYDTFPFTNGMEKISELRLYGNVVLNLELLRSTPNLKLLHMDLFGIEKRNELKENADTWFEQKLCYMWVDYLVLGVQAMLLPNLEHFHVNCFLNAATLKKLSSWMPNLKTLKTVLIEGSVSVISEQWPLLEHLVGLHGSKIEDKDIFHEKDQSLLNFTALRSFQLDTCCNEGLLTDQVVDSGFLKMHSLDDLQICVSKQFSEEAEKRLRRHIPTTRVIRNYKENEHHVNWECCQIMDFIQFVQENFEKVIKKRGPIEF